MGDTLKTGVSHGETSKTAVDKSIARHTVDDGGHTADGGHTEDWGQPREDIHKSSKRALTSPLPLPNTQLTTGDTQQKDTQQTGFSHWKTSKRAVDKSIDRHTVDDGGHTVDWGQSK